MYVVWLKVLSVNMDVNLFRFGWFLKVFFVVDGLWILNACLICIVGSFWVLQ